MRADLLAWLDGKPVAARTPTRRYRLGRFIRRNVLAVGAAAAVVVALCAGLGMALWQAREARLQAQRADVVNAYLVDVFSSIDPDEGLGPHVTAGQLIDQGVARLDRGQLRAQPGAEGKLRLTLADSYVALGEFPKADAQLARALVLLPPTQVEDVLQARVRQGEVRLEVEDLEGLQRNLDANADWLQAHASALSELQADTAQQQMMRAKLLAHREQYTAAEKLARTAWEHMRDLRGHDDARTRALLVDYAEILSNTGKYADAAGLAQHVVDSIRRVKPLNEFRLASALHNLAVYQGQAGGTEQAVATERQALAIRRRILPVNHPFIGASLGDLANMLETVGQNQASLPLHAQATAIYRAQPPGQEDELGRELNNWGVACYELGDMACATDKLNETVSIWSKVLPADHARLLTARSNLAALYSRAGQLREGEVQLRQVVAAMQAKDKTGAETIIFLSGARNELADNLLNQGRNAEALALSRQRWAELQAGGAPAESVPSALSMLALTELASGISQPALTHAQAAADSARASAPDSRREAFALMTLARAQLASGDAASAVWQARKAITMFTTALSADHRDTGLAHGVLGRALLASGQHAESRKEFSAAIAILSKQASWLPELAELRRLR